MKVKSMMPDQHGTVFLMGKRITRLVLDKLTSSLKRFGTVSQLDDDYTFLVIHDDEVSKEEIKLAIEKIVF